MTPLRTPSRLAATVATAAAAVLLGAGAVLASVTRDVPFVPTPPQVVDAMLEMGQVKADDILYDLGSGDGRIVVAAVRDRGVKKGVGVDIDPERVEDGRRNAAQAGVSDRATFTEGNVFTFDFTEATVVTMYLLPSVNLKLRPRVLSELRPGTRVVSHQFDMGDWKPDETRRVGYADVHLWIVPAAVDGGWTWSDGGATYRLELKQQYQQVTGTLAAGGDARPISNARLSGDTLSFEAPGRGGTVRFSGKVAGDRIAARVNGRDVTAQRAR